MLKDKNNFFLKKQGSKKILKATRANLVNSWLKLWVYDYFLEDKSEKNHEV
jgi:hypothetical protein